MIKPRDMKQDAGGFWRYTDTRERVFPDAMKPGPQPTDVQRNLVAAGYEPGTDEFRQALREHMTKPLSRTDVRLPAGHQETEEATTVGEWYGTPFTPMQEAAQRESGRWGKR